MKGKDHEDLRRLMRSERRRRRLETETAGSALPADFFDDQTVRTKRQRETDSIAGEDFVKQAKLRDCAFLQQGTDSCVRPSGTSLTRNGESGFATQSGGGSAVSETSPSLTSGQIPASILKKQSSLEGTTKASPKSVVFAEDSRNQVYTFEVEPRTAPWDPLERSKGIELWHGRLIDHIVEEDIEDSETEDMNTEQKTVPQHTLLVQPGSATAAYPPVAHLRVTANNDLEGQYRSFLNELVTLKDPPGDMMESYAKDISRDLRLANDVT
eukprot:Gregarina_sp_Poly_1__4509@NODE_2422_length_2152_cov_148_309353_g1308_i1_p1_GENE_NODE_2422_length_2152_cov_148_309353_g1308_i1NODE_2422_length_2152_cov_148_309353_g1308_i1_p1_ORF_typecomplete_len306_score44_89_NODE_2422_length_2152_cov_148_309353_g1308_i112332039